MAKAILICGKLCSGKSTYAEKLKLSDPAVILSSDEAVLRLFGHYLGDDHDRITKNVNTYLLDLALQILESGTNVILDWGFWTEDVRKATDAFFRTHGATVEWHFLDVSDTIWQKNIIIRNQAVKSGISQAFLVDAGLLKKFEGMFQKPERAEMDVWYENQWQ